MSRCPRPYTSRFQRCQSRTMPQRLPRGRCWRRRETARRPQTRAARARSCCEILGRQSRLVHCGRQSGAERSSTDRTYSPLASDRTLSRRPSPFPRWNANSTVPDGPGPLLQTAKRSQPVGPGSSGQSDATADDDQVNFSRSEFELSQHRCRYRSGDCWASRRTASESGHQWRCRLGGQCEAVSGDPRLQAVVRPPPVV